MIENLVFYNHWQNGDIHVSREFVKFFTESIDAKNYYYLHHKSEELLKDIPKLQIKSEGLIYLDNDSPYMWNLHTRTLCLNPFKIPTGFSTAAWLTKFLQYSSHERFLAVFVNFIEFLRLTS